MNTNISGRVSVQGTEHSEAMEIYNFTRVLAERELSPFSLGHFVVHAGLQSALDQHAVKEYWFIAGGEGILEIDGIARPAKQGEVFFFDSQVTHMITNSSAVRNLEIFSIWW